MDTKQTPALEEMHQLEPLAADTKKTLALEESHRLEPLAEKQKTGYTVTQENEVLPLLQSLLVQNDIQRVCDLYIQILLAYTLS